MRIFGLHTGDRYCLLFCHKSGTIVPQPHKKCLWKQTDKRNCNTTDSKIRNRHCKKKSKCSCQKTQPYRRCHRISTPFPKQKEKNANFPRFQSSSQNSLSGEMLLYANCSKIHIFNIRQRSPALYFNRFARKTPTKIQAETGILLFHTRPTYTFLQFMRFSPDSEDFYMPKVQKLFWHPVIFHRRSSDRVHRCHVPRHQGTLPHLNADVPVLNYALNTHQ